MLSTLHIKDEPSQLSRDGVGTERRLEIQGNYITEVPQLSTLRTNVPFFLFSQKADLWE